MGRKSYKQKYNELKSELYEDCNSNTDNKIMKHTKRYIHIPFSWKAIGRFFILMGSMALAVLNFMFMIAIGKTYKVWDLLGSNPELVNHSFSQLIIVYPLIAQFFLVGLVIVCLRALINGGFYKLSYPYNMGTVYGLGVGMILGLFAGGVADGIILGLIVGGIMAVILGLGIGVFYAFFELEID